MLLSFGCKPMTMNLPSEHSLLSVNIVEVAMLGRACKQSLLSLKRNFVRCLLTLKPKHYPLVPQ